MAIKRYQIEVFEDKVSITGMLTVREMFDHLNYFDREGYGFVNARKEISGIEMSILPEVEKEEENG
jgi:hypothetical protein